jgi:hypothetical protein
MMDEIQGTAVLIALFALRCIAPLVITLVIGYFMNRLVDRWQAEDLAQEAELEAAPTLIPPEAIETSVVPGQKRRPLVAVPCWVLRNCDEAKMADCPARKMPFLPLPDMCIDCDLYDESELGLGTAFG